MLWSVFFKFKSDTNGATAMEYCLIAALVALAGIIAFTASGDSISATFADISEDFCTAVGGSFSLTANGSGSCTF
ncbi:MAG: Flp family type IVb pilin [Sneathiella sp.]|nr:Flp family type IVb pilin [Sneathiella sp.]